MAVRDDRGDVKQTTAGFRDPRHHICQKQIPIPWIKRLVEFNREVRGALEMGIHTSFSPNQTTYANAPP